MNAKEPIRLMLGGISRFYITQLMQVYPPWLLYCVILSKSRRLIRLVAFSNQDHGRPIVFVGYR